MSEEAEDILGSFGSSEGDAKKYETVESKFNAHFIPRSKIIFKRAKFISCKQEEGEPVHTYIMALHTLSEHCGYGALRNEMIRDRIVVGVCNAQLSEKLQLVSELDLDQAITQVRQMEVVKLQQTVLRGECSTKPDAPVGAGHKGHNRARQPSIRSRQSGATTRSRVDESSTRCTRCGKHPAHEKDRYSARDAVCHKCKKQGQFQTVCRSSAKVSGVQVKSEERDAFLGALQDDKRSPENNPWTMTLHLENQPVQFHLDTGAEVAVVSEQTWRNVEVHCCSQVYQSSSLASFKDLEGSMETTPFIYMKELSPLPCPSLAEWPSHS